MQDFVHGDKFGGSKYVQSGTGNTFNVTTTNGVSQAELDAAVRELRAFVAQLGRDGAVAADGTVTDPAAVVAAVQEARPGRLRALAGAVAGGASEAVLGAVQDGVANLVVGLLGPPA